MNRVLCVLEYVPGLFGAMIGHIDHGSFATQGPVSITLSLVLLFLAWVRHPLGVNGTQRAS